jgi:hypothetical protein
MNWQSVFLGVGALALLAAFASDAQAQKKDVKIGQKWSGSVEDENLKKDVPEVITNAKTLEKVWTAWKIEGKVPEIDFTKEIVVVATSVGSKLNMGGAKLDDKGNLDVLAFGTLDIRPGFRYVMGTVSREGIKTVNKKELPKE